MLNRREFLRAIELGMVVAMTPAAVFAQGVNDDVLLDEAADFPDDFVVELARKRAAEPYAEEVMELPAEIADLSYDQYRDIRFDTDKSIWKGKAEGFSFDLFHPGFYYKSPVDIHVVEDGVQRRIRYVPDLFRFGPSVTPPTEGNGLSYAGFRMRYPINRPDYDDEFLVFQGASYFRAVGKNEIYGLSARGLAIDTAQPQGEEFPSFRSFWVRRPKAGSSFVVVHALLDTKSCTGAYRFTVRPGESTMIDVELVLFPRVEMAHVGFAPLTSMFMFDDTNRAKVDDFRSAVHDSDGLSILNGKGEWIWRPLANPATLQVSAFVDTGPRGFGLLQRKRDYDLFLDLEAKYEKRPSLWVEPVGDWGSGHVELIEIPTDREIHDNIVAYWRPEKPLAAGGEFSLTYRLHWGADLPEPARNEIARATFSGAGLNFEQTRRQFIIEFVGPGLSDDMTAEVNASAGKVVNAIVHHNHETGGYRLSFELDPEGATLSEIRALLRKGDEAVSETWLYRWTA